MVTFVISNAITEVPAVGVTPVELVIVNVRYCEPVIRLVPAPVQPEAPRVAVSVGSVTELVTIVGVAPPTSKPVGAVQVASPTVGSLEQKSTTIAFTRLVVSEVKRIWYVTLRAVAAGLELLIKILRL